MLIKFKYQNHEGKEFTFGENCVFANQNGLYDYEWGVSAVGNRVGKLERKIATRTLPIVFISSTPTEVEQAIDDLVDLAEIDTTAKKSGSILMNSYKFRCFIIKVNHVEWIEKGGYCKVDLIIQPDGGVWTREFDALPFSSSQSSITLEGEENFLQPFKKYASPLIEETDYESFMYGVQAHSGEVISQRNYSYQYAESNDHKQIEVIGNCKMRISIHGPCSLAEGLSIVIGGQTYRVGGENCPISLYANEKLVIDQERETIEKENAYGVKTNAFAVWMDMTVDLFKPLPPGIHDVMWSGVSFYITLIEERSSPRWH